MTAAVGAPRSALDWMELHLRCLYTHDARGRIGAAREPGFRRAARFHLGRTRLGNLWRFRDDVSAASVRALSRLAGREGPRPSDGRPPERCEPMRALLRSDAEIESEWAGPAYYFPESLPSQPASDAVVEVGPGDEHLLEREFADWIPELALRQPCTAWLEDGQAVSLCESARPLSVSGAAESPVSEAGVATAVGHRGRGYAPAVVGAWARAIRAAGGEPLYSTAWTNKSSQTVARKLQLVCYGEDLHFT